MCGVCGCGQTESPRGEHLHVQADGSVVRHTHGHAHDEQGGHGQTHEHLQPDGSRVVHADHGHEHGHEQEHGHPHAHAPASEEGAARARRVKVEQDILSKNDAQARINRARFEKHGARVVNLMSSPGSGKTTLLVKTLAALQGRAPLAVIEGDQQTSLDADRIRQTGVPAFQVNTGKGCHLDATMVDRALERLPMPAGGVLFIENVGNLVCPAGFDLGESAKVVVLSVTEGEDKPLKYPDMFAIADLVLVTKVDLLPHLDLDVNVLEQNLRRVRPGVPVLRLSAKTGEGFEAWQRWLLEKPGAAGA